MKFNAPEGFDLTAFLAAVSLGGTELQASEAVPTPDGCILLQSDRLEVTLVEPTQAKWDLISQKAVELGATPI